MEAVTASGYRLARVAWRPEHIGLFLPAFGGDLAAVEAVGNVCQANEAELYEVFGPEGEQHGACVTRFDGVEFEVIAACGHGANLAEEILPELEALAERLLAAGIRINTYRPGLVRKLAGSGYRALHLCMWKPIHGKQ